jgi:hypothetical protein
MYNYQTCSAKAGAALPKAACRLGAAQPTLPGLFDGRELKRMHLLTDFLRAAAD